MKRISAVLLCSIALFGHPMGNFSVNHYTRLQVNVRGVQLRYVLDLAEIPTFELLRNWNIDRSAPQSELEVRGAKQAREWLQHLRILVDGRPAQAKFQSAQVTIADGAGNLPIIRVDIAACVDDSAGGKFNLEDQNFSDRAGWKEIVIDSGQGVSLVKATPPGKELSEALKRYPPDPTVAPPQDLRAELEWRVEKPVVAARSSKRFVAPSMVDTAPKAAILGATQPIAVRDGHSPAIRTAQAAPPGSVVRGDFLSKVLHREKLTPSVMLVAFLVAFGLGAAHALTPGHGKTIVAAYLVGSRGTLKHAAFLGATVTFTHTVAVFALGFATLFLFRYVVPEKITLVLGAVSGLSIVAVGAWMLHKRLAKADRSHVHAHGHLVHAHHHSHGNHGHSHSHEHVHEHAHDHHHGSHTHSHIPDEVSWGGLIALGASGGLVPCESGLVLLLGAIALGRVGFGLVLLVAFSMGLAIVLMLIGMLVLYAKNLLPERTRLGAGPFLRLISIASPVLVMIVGLLMTGVSLGWINTKWMIG
jgi:nickel/cobalt transporter (NicO) family protein